MITSWVEDLIQENQTVETPESWLFWSLMFCISSAAANAYTLRTLKGNLLYYPNLYIILMGESGLGKGYPVNLAKRLLQEADITRVIAGRSSIQAIIKEGATTRSTPGKAIITDSRMAVVNGELSTAIIQDPDSLTILTDLYDRSYNPAWVNLLKGDGAEKLKEPYITCLFGSSPAHFYDSIPQANIEGGYIGRNLVIYEEKRSKDVDLLDSEEESVDEDRFTNYIVPKYVPHLQKIAAHKARLIPEESARKAFNTWRKEWRNTQAQYNDRTGFVNRVPDHVLKVAMCFALARYNNDNAVIIESDIKEAIQRISGLIYASEKAASGGGLDPMAAQTKRVVDTLIAVPENQLLRKDLLIRGYGDYDTMTLDKIIDTLMEMGWVKRQKVGIGVNSDWLYLLAGEPKENLMRFRAQNNGRLR
jgi:energy-coupling factor transporter ATP-binding protein EcfA2